MNSVLSVAAVFLSHVVQGISGFAGTVPVGMRTFIAVMNMPGILASLSICAVAWRRIRPHYAIPYACHEMQ
jgi:hypothetical protein